MNSSAPLRGCSVPAPGYAGAYARTLGHIGTPLSLPRSGSHLLARKVQRSDFLDAVGPYPFFACDDWTALADDLAGCDDRFVSVTVVPDPLGDFDLEVLAQAFPAQVRAWKRHWVVDFRKEPALGAHHARNLRRARAAVDVEYTAEPAAWRDDWIRLYAGLKRRHAIGDAADFPVTALARQLELPGMEAFRARSGGTTVGMALFLSGPRGVYYHLGAYDDAGYATKASYALMGAAIEHYGASGRDRLLLGAGAGTDTGSPGLERFKRGWANTSIQGYLCGRVGDARAYAALSQDLPGDFFPAYRGPSAR